jgi:hypothetical protein
MPNEPGGYPFTLKQSRTALVTAHRHRSKNHDTSKQWFLGHRRLSRKLQNSLVQQECNRTQPFDIALIAEIIPNDAQTLRNGLPNY